MKTVRRLSRTTDKPFVAAVPGSKSFTNRALILAAQRPGRTLVSNALICDDTLYLAQALDHFEGLSVRSENNSFVVERRTGQLGAPEEPLYVGGAGTPARFLLAFAAAASGETRITGNPRLCERPMDDLLAAFERMGIPYQCHQHPGCLPVTVQGAEPTTRQWTVHAGVSSQFVSALMLHAAQQHVGPVEIILEGEPVSRPYIDMTRQMMRDCGIEISESGSNQFTVVPATPQAEEIPIEVDASGMSYLLTAAAITGTRVEIPGIGRDSLQGDLGLVHCYERMGCEVELAKDCVRLSGRALHGIDVDMESMPDVVLSLAVAASCASTPSCIRNIANLRVKECDRIHAIAAELDRLGLSVEEGRDWIRIYPGTPKAGVTVKTYDDHRVAMAFSLLGLLHEGIELDDHDCVRKSFPGFWEEMERFCAHHMRIEEEAVSI